jgi:xanthine dehydrogenase accessory factor
MDKDLLQVLYSVQQAEDKAALITIIATRGSTPRKAGAKMVIWADGRTYGTIGGGCGEAEVRGRALQALDEQQTSLYTVRMLNDIAADEGMVCGGIMEVFIQCL